MNCMMIENGQIRNLIKEISSNLMRAQNEESNEKDTSLRNFYLDKAGYDSVFLAKLLLEINDAEEGSRYFLSAAYSYEKSGALNQSLACYNKILEIGREPFLSDAEDGMSRINSLKKRKLDISTKEGKIKALDFLIWEYYGLTTTDAKDYFLKEFMQEVSNESIRSYAKILEERKRVVIWGGPQGREYHIYPNIADLATRNQHYGKISLFAGLIQSRVTQQFKVKFENWDYNKELFTINSSIKPKMIMAVDMDAFVKNLKIFTTPNFSLKALGTLKKSTDLEDNGYKTTLPEELDLIDSNVLYNGITDETIYSRELCGGHMIGN